MAAHCAGGAFASGVDERHAARSPSRASVFFPAALEPEVPAPKI